MNRNRLFAAIEHVERIHAAAIEHPKRPQRAPPPPPAPTPRARAEALFGPRPTLTASPAALATAAQRAKRTQLPTVIMPVARDGAIRLTAKALKVTVVLDPVMVGEIELSRGAAAPALIIEVDGRRVRAQVSAKGLRKALGLIAEHGADQVAVILQGKLVADDVIAEAGIVAQVRTPKIRTCA